MEPTSAVGEHAKVNDEAQSIAFRRGTADEWIAANPVLDEGEPGVEMPDGLLKIGDGATKWSSLDYVAAPDWETPGDRISWPPGLVAFFPTNEFGAGSSLVSRAGVRDFEAKLVEGTAQIDPSERGPFGNACYFDGATVFAVGWGEDQIGELDVTTYGTSYTCVTWVRDLAGEDSGYQAFRGGSHVEGGPLSARQYGIYYNNGLYGARKRLAPHVATQDGNTPGYPFNADYGADGMQFCDHKWHMEVATYDGVELWGYLDGLSTPYVGYSDDPGLLPGQSIRRENISKNPYVNTLGINSSATKKIFSLGGAISTLGGYHPLNFLHGLMSGFAVFNRALTPEEIFQIRMNTIAPSEPIKTYTFYSHVTAEGTNLPGKRPTQHLGWRSWSQEAALDRSSSIGHSGFVLKARDGQSFLSRRPSSDLALAFIELRGTGAGDIRRIGIDVVSQKGGTGLFPAIRANDRWFVSREPITAQFGKDWDEPTRSHIRLFDEKATWNVLRFEQDGHVATKVVKNLATNPGLALGVSAGGGRWLGIEENGSSSIASVSGRSPVAGTTGSLEIAFGAGTATPSSGVSYEFVAGVSGLSYTASMFVRPSRTQRMLMQASWVYQKGDGYLNIPDSPVISGEVAIVPKGEFSRLSVFAGDAPASPSGQPYLRLYLQTSRTGDNWRPGDTCEFTGVMVTTGDQLEDFFTGASEGASWDGAPDESTSSRSVEYSCGLLAPTDERVDIEQQLNSPITAVGVVSKSVSDEIGFANVSLYRY